MRLTVPRKSFLAACKIAAQAVPTRTTNPVLGNLRMEASGGKVSVSATDLEVGVTVKVKDARVEASGDCLVSADKFLKLLNEDPAEQLDLDANGKAVLVTGAGSRYSLPWSDPTRFPASPQIKGGILLTVPDGILPRYVAAVRPALASINATYASAAICLEVKGRFLTVIGTDTKILAVCRWGEPPANESPTKSLLVMPTALKVLQGISGEIQIVGDDNIVGFNSDVVQSWSRQVAGRYPPWRQIWPSVKGQEFTLQAGEFRRAIRCARLASSLEQMRVEFRFVAGKGYLSSAGEGEAEVELDVPGAEDSSFCLDPEMALDALKPFGEEEPVQVIWTARDRPVIFRSESGWYECLLMQFAPKN